MNPKIVYCTTDDCDLLTAQGFGADCQLDVEWFFPKELSNGVPKDAAGIIYDLDYLAWGAEWQQLVERLAANRPQLPTAVHSYALAKDETEALQQQGIVVHRCLDRELFIRLSLLISAWGEDRVVA